MTHVLITRPQPDALTLQARIEALGCKVSLAPLITIAFQDIPIDAVAGTKALIATSQNGLRALAKSQALPMAVSLPVFAVGPATAALAQSLGFQDIRAGAGTAADLVPLIALMGLPDGERMLHLSGDHLAFDLAGALAAHGIVLNSVQAYMSVAVKTLPADAAAALNKGQIDAVILMSPRTAQIWSGCVANVVDGRCLARLTHICLSAAVANALMPPPEIISIAARPNAEEILAVVKRLAAH